MNPRSRRSPNGSNAWDERYFGLILELEKKNFSRYENQSAKLLKQKILEVDVRGIKIKYKVDGRGCSFLFGEPESPFGRESWVLMGWGKSAKGRALPNFFARSEAAVIFELEN